MLSFGAEGAPTASCGDEAATLKISGTRAPGLCGIGKGPTHHRIPPKLQFYWAGHWSHTPLHATKKAVIVITFHLNLSPRRISTPTPRALSITIQSPFNAANHGLPSSNGAGTDGGPRTAPVRVDGAAIGLPLRPPTTDAAGSVPTTAGAEAVCLYRHGGARGSEREHLEADVG